MRSTGPDADAAGRHRPREGDGDLRRRLARATPPVPGAYVRLLDGTGEFTAEVVTSATGDFRFFAAPGDVDAVGAAPRRQGPQAVHALAPGPGSRRGLAVAACSAVDYGRDIRECVPDPATDVRGRAGAASVDEGLDAVGEDLVDEADADAGDPHARRARSASAIRAGPRTGCRRSASRRRAPRRAGRPAAPSAAARRPRPVPGTASQAASPVSHSDTERAGGERGRGDRERLRAPLGLLRAGGALDDQRACHGHDPILRYGRRHGDDLPRRARMRLPRTRRRVSLFRGAVVASRPVSRALKPPLVLPVPP